MAGCGGGSDVPGDTKANLRNLGVGDTPSKACLDALRLWCQGQQQVLDCETIAALAGCGPASYVMCKWPMGKTQAIEELKDLGEDEEDSEAIAAIEQVCAEYSASKEV